MGALSFFLSISDIVEVLVAWAKEIMTDPCLKLHIVNF